MRVTLWLCYISTSSATVNYISGNLLDPNDYVQASDEPLYNADDFSLPDIPNGYQDLDPASSITQAGADEALLPEISQGHDGTDAVLYDPSSVELTGPDEGLDLEDSALLSLSDHIDPEPSAAISCEPDASSTIMQKRQGGPPPPDMCFDNSGGICPRESPNLVCCQEKVMYTSVLVRGCVICMLTPVPKLSFRE